MSTAAAAGSLPALAPVSDGPTTLDIPSRPKNVPSHGFWRVQQDVETLLGLETGAISKYFMALGLGRNARARCRKVKQDLAKAGVYRHNSTDRSGKKTHWVAFVGEGGRKPKFKNRGEDNSIPPDMGGAGESGPQPAVAPASAPEGDSRRSAACVGEPTQRVSEVMRRRCVQV